MTKIANPVKTIKTRIAARKYDQMIKASQAKLAETTPVSYTRIYA